jgi:hypothetical protein
MKKALNTIDEWENEEYWSDEKNVNIPFDRIIL